QGTLSEARLEKVVITPGGLGGHPGSGLWIRADAVGGLELVDSRIAGIKNESANFVLGAKP
ncbi:MAG: hypothetical protein ABUL65_05220, partial [Opitutus sp.]